MRIVAPDTSDKERPALGLTVRRQGLEGCRKRRKQCADAGTVQIDHGLTDVNANGAARHRKRLTDHGKIVPGVTQLTRHQRHCRSVRTEQQQDQTLCLQALHTGQLASGLNKFGVEVNRIASAQIAGTAQVQIGRQHLVQPVNHGTTKARHHHRKSHCQTERSDHCADCHRRALAHTPRPFDRKQRQCVAAQPRRQLIEQDTDQPGQSCDAAQQQQTDRQVGRQWQVKDRWSACQQGAADEQQDAEPVTALRHQVRAQTFERQGRCQALCLARRPPATKQRDEGAQAAVEQGCRKVPLQCRRCTGKVAASEVAAQQTQRERRQRATERDAGGATEQAQRQ